MPPLEKVKLKPLGLAAGGRGLVLEGGIDTLPKGYRIFDNEVIGG